MKRVLLSLVGACLMCSCFVNAFAEGSFTGTAEGHNGPISVSVSLDAQDAIASIEVTNHLETVGISDRAIGELPQRIVEAQSLSVDGMTGATFTSRGIVNAVKNAIESAGLDPESYALPLPEKEKEQLTYDVDIVVVGAGISGLSAATYASESGKSVLVIEKQSQAGGSALLAAGITNVGGTSVQRENGVYDSPEQNVMDLANPASSYQSDDPVFTLMMHRLGSDMIDELRIRGLEFVEYNPVRSRIHVFGPAMYQGGNALAQLWLGSAKEAGAQMLLDTKVTELIIDEDAAVTGVKAEGKDADYTVHAGAVILATGGYSNNKSLVSELTPEYADLLSRDNVGASGDGIDLATSAGGYLWAADAGYQLFCVDTKRMYDLPTMSTFASSIMVNKEGDRFVNESVPFTVSARALWGQEGSTGWFVFDDTARAMHAPIEHYFELGLVTEADSIEELADAINAPNLVSTVERYNAMTGEGTDEDFGRAIGLLGVTGEHFYAIGIRPAMYVSFGGIKSDESFRVVREDGTPVKGLYAAGEVLGSLEAQEGRAYTSGLMQGMVTGKVAAGTAVFDLLNN